MLTTEQRAALTETMRRELREDTAGAARFVSDYARVIRALNHLKEEKSDIV